MRSRPPSPRRPVPAREAALDPVRRVDAALAALSGLVLAAALIASTGERLPFPGARRLPHPDVLLDDAVSAPAVGPGVSRAAIRDRHREAATPQAAAWPAHLPPLQDIGPGRSVAAFMQPDVPHAVRNSALRQLWRVDRDLGHPETAPSSAGARPDGDPAFGPLETTAEMVRTVEATMTSAIARAQRLPRDDEAPRDLPRSAVRLEDDSRREP